MQNSSCPKSAAEKFSTLVSNQIGLLGCHVLIQESDWKATLSAQIATLQFI